MNLKNAARLITFASVVQVLGYFYALPGHIGDPTWSHHAQFHLFLSWLWIVGLDISIIAFASASSTNLGNIGLTTQR